MRVRETQTLGALMILVASMVVYGGSLLNDRYPFAETSLPWGNQGPGMIAAEISVGRGTDGVYFLPDRMTIATMLKIVGMEGKIEPAHGSLFADTAYTICQEDGLLRIGAMPTVRRLALGMPIDLNRATAEELSQVPGIGERLAVQIVQLRRLRRQFESLTDLTAVQGIKEKKLNNLKKYLTVRPEP
jgi:competence ComEA-like helix-hairpin-helix protein